jgi:hypothetical protein
MKATHKKRDSDEARDDVRDVATDTHTRASHAMCVQEVGCAPVQASASICEQRNSRSRQHSSKATARQRRQRPRHVAYERRSVAVDTAHAHLRPCATRPTVRRCRGGQGSQPHATARAGSPRPCCQSPALPPSRQSEPHPNHHHRRCHGPQVVQLHQSRWLTSLLYDFEHDASDG